MGARPPTDDHRLPVDTEGTRSSPRRFVRAMYEATAGYEGDPKLLTAFPTECRGGPDCQISQVIEGPIPFFSLCEHHAFPFFGVAHVGYVAHEQIIGISKLTRLVRVYARPLVSPCSTVRACSADALS